MASIATFFTLFVIVSAIAAVAFIALAGTWAVQFFARNRQVRVASHQPIGSYYRGLAFSH